MKTLIIGLLLIMGMIPLAHAATDCEKNCCRTYDGSWDEDFDDCRQPKTGFDTCVSDCEAAVWAARPQGPGPASPENTYHCKVGAILLSVCVATVLMAKKV
jgi:hypothetical protein